MFRVAPTSQTCPLPLAWLFLLNSAGCSGGGESTAERASASDTLRVAVIEVAEQEWPRLVATQGDLVADETTVVGAKVAGRIESVGVDLGDVMEAGTVLASLDRRDYEERVRQAEAELAQSRAAIGLDADDELAKVDPQASPVVVEQKALWNQARADRERIAGLRARQAVSEAQYEAAVAAEQVAEARQRAALNAVREKIALIRVRATQLEVARRELEDAQIRAPFHGRVQDRHVAPGMYVQIGDAVVTLVRNDPLRYRGTVPEPYASSIAVGQRVRLRVETGPELPEVTITRISPAIDPLSRSLLFEALVPNPDHAIQAGQFAQGEVLLSDTRRVIALPKSAVVEFAGTRKVWKVVGGQAVEQPVETGTTRDGHVEVLDGVSAGDYVLVDGSQGRAGKVDAPETSTASPVVSGAPPATASR